MKKNIGNILALYPTPAVVVGKKVNGKVNWLLVAHVGIIGHDQIMLSLFKKHYTNEGIKQTGKVSVNMVNEAMLVRADYVGCASGAKADKSDVFVYHLGEAGTPVISSKARKKRGTRCSASTVLSSRWSRAAPATVAAWTGHVFSTMTFRNSVRT